MISKEERERDRAICDAATPGWMQGDHVGEPAALCAAADPETSLLGLDKDGMAIFCSDSRAQSIANAAAAVTGRNRLPIYIADAEEMERRIAIVEALEVLAVHEARSHEGGAQNTATRVMTLRHVIGILRGEQ